MPERPRGTEIMKPKQTVILAASLLACLLSVSLLATACGVPASAAVSDELDKAIGDAVLSQLDGYLSGEAKAEGHIVLSTKGDGDGNTVVYAIASCSWYGFEKNMFTVKSGCGAIPVVIIFSKTEAGYSLLSYTEPEDGEGYADSVRQLFPIFLWPKLFLADRYYGELQKQQEEQAAAYLKSIGRDAVIHSEYIEEEPFRISVEAYNTLFCMPELCDYPSFVGTFETVEDGMRCIYEANEEDFTGYAIITYTKRTENGNILQQYKYKVTGDTVTLIK